MKYMNEHNSSHDLMDMVTIGERGQIVIPAPIREKYGLSGGDKLMIIAKGDMIGLVPSSKFRAMIAGLTAKLSELDDSTDDASEVIKDKLS
jgi:AbrB family looped-hinge helix DNA binding protein